MLCYVITCSELSENDNLKARINVFVIKQCNSNQTEKNCMIKIQYSFVKKDTKWE